MLTTSSVVFYVRQFNSTVYEYNFTPTNKNDTILQQLKIRLILFVSIVSMA